MTDKQKEMGGSVFCPAETRVDQQGAPTRTPPERKKQVLTHRKTSSVRFHGDVGRCRTCFCAPISAGDDVIGQLGCGGGACVGGRQSGLPDLVFTLVEEDVGCTGLDDKRHTVGVYNTPAAFITQ